MIVKPNGGSIRCFSVIQNFAASLLGIGLALCLGASNDPPGPTSPAPTSPPATTSTSASTSPPLVYAAQAPAPGTPFVGVVGDSTGTQLAQPLAAVLNPRGVGVVRATVGGCQSTDLVLTYGNPEYFLRHQNCPLDAQRLQNTMTTKFSPKVVIWSDTVDWSDIKINDHIVTAGTGQWRELMFDGWSRVLRRLGSAAVVLILPTWWAGYPTDGPAAFPVERQRALFRTWAARHPDQVTVVDLGPVLCPSGPPCPRLVHGVQPRSDHIHYTPEGTRMVIAKLMADVTALSRLGGER